MQIHLDPERLTQYRRLLALFGTEVNALLHHLGGDHPRGAGSDLLFNPPLEAFANDVLDHSGPMGYLAGVEAEGAHEGFLELCLHILRICSIDHSFVFKCFAEDLSRSQVVDLQQVLDRRQAIEAGSIRYTLLQEELQCSGFVAKASAKSDEVLSPVDHCFSFD